MLKGIKPINSYLNKWLKENQFECKTQLGTDFCYLEDKDIIEYCFVIPGGHNEMFFEVCKECNPNIQECDPFITSFFHELGHFETQGMFEEKEWKNYFKLCNKLRNKKENTDTDYWKYFHHPIELEATRWATDFIVDNEDKIYDWWNHLQPLILDFYTLNNVEDK